MLLEKHGLVTWGETRRGELRGDDRVRRRAPPSAIDEPAAAASGSAAAVAELADERAEPLLARRFRRSAAHCSRTPTASCSRSTAARRRWRSPPSARAPEVSQVGAPCPDHLINTKHKPLVVDFDPARDDAASSPRRFARGVDEYAAWYRDYYERNLDDETRPFPIDPAGPRVVLVPGVGIVTSGARRRPRPVRRDLYHRAIAVEDAADALGGFRSLSESEAFAIEYWPLERYKLAQAPPRGELAGRVALITGGASGIGRATARMLAARGAHVVRRRPERRRRRRGGRRSSSPRTAFAARSRSTST